MSNFAAGAAATPMADEQHPFLQEEVVPSSSRSHFRFKALGVAACIAAAGTAAWCHGRHHSEVAWSGKNNNMFLAEVKSVDPVGINAIKSESSAVAAEVKEGAKAVKATEQMAHVEMTLAQAVKKQETEDITQANEVVETGKALMDESKSAKDSAASIGKMAAQDTTAAQAVEKQAEEDLKGAEKIMDDAKGSAAKSIIKMANEQKEEAQDAVDRAHKEIDNAKDMEDKAQMMKAEAAEKAQAAEFLTKAGQSQAEVAKPVLKDAETAIAHAKSLKQGAEEMEDKFSDQQDKKESLDKAADATEDKLVDQAQNKADAKVDLAAAIAKEKEARSDIADSKGDMKMSAQEVDIAAEIRKRVAQETAAISNLVKAGFNTDDAEVFKSIGSELTGSAADTMKGTKSEAGNAADLVNSAKDKQHDAAASVSDAKAAQAAAQKVIDEANKLIESTNSEDFMGDYKQGAVKAVTDTAAQDQQIAKSIVATKESDAKLLAAVEAQAQNQMEAAENLDKMAAQDKVAKGDSAGPKAMEAAGKDLAKAGEKTDDVAEDARKDLAKITADAKIADAAEAKLEEAKELAKQLGIKESTTPAPADGKCCSYEGSGVCGKQNEYCDSAADACDKCGGKFIKRA